MGVQSAHGSALPLGLGRGRCSSVGWFGFFFLLSLNPDLSTLPFWCAAKQNACKESTEQKLGQAHESPTYFGGSSGFAYKGCVCQSLRKSVSMHFGLMGLFVTYLTIK